MQPLTTQFAYIEMKRKLKKNKQFATPGPQQEM